MERTHDGAPGSELLDELARTLRRFGARLQPREIDSARALPPGLLREMQELGLFGVTIPEAYGGCGLGLAAACRVASSLARYDRSVATTIGLHLGLGTRGLVAFGSDALKERVLPRLAAGTLAAFAATEAGAGSDLTAIATRALPEAQGLLRVDGEKIYVTNGGLAGVFTLLVSTPWARGGRKAQSLLLLERADAGLATGAEEEKLGLRGSSTTSLAVDGVVVDAARIIGEPGTGAEQAGHVLSWGRTVMAAGCVGAAQAALDAAVRHACLRQQFGRPLWHLEVVRDQLAGMAARLFAMEALVEDAAAAAGDAELLACSLAAKVLCSEGAGEICDTALQLHGGSGFIEETGLPLLYRDLRVTRIFEGANDVLLTHAGLLAVITPATRAEEARAVPGTSAALATRLEELRGGFREHVSALKKQHGVRLMRQQRLLHRIGRLSVLAASAEAAVRRANAEGTEVGTAHAAHWLELAARSQSLARLAPPAAEPIDAIVAAHTGGAAS